MALSPRRCALLALLSCLLPLAASQAADLPADVAAFTTQRETCEHFLGEEPYDAERAAELAAAAQKYCTTLNTQWAQLRARYKNDKAALAALGEELPLAE